MTDGPRSASPGSRWRGFNLLEMYGSDGRPAAPFLESDFEWMAEWGFNFARLPLSYRCWSSPDRPFELQEEGLRQIDAAVELGRRYGIHVCLNFHRAPGYCINPPAEPWDLWRDAEARRVFAHHWGTFAGRYRGIASELLSFNLVNEPRGCEPSVYAGVMREAVAVIRAADPERLVMVDGLLDEPPRPTRELSDLPLLVHGTRGYAPHGLTHYLAPWAGAPDRLPAWPMPVDGAGCMDRAALRERCIRPWQEFEAEGNRVFVGEFGAWNQTPHEVTLRWMLDCLELWQEAGWGWALWNLRGTFGVLDSERGDVRYESWRGHALDRQMLELLRAH